MRSFLIILLLSLFSCSHDKKPLSREDVLTQIIEVQKKGTKKALLQVFGQPIEKRNENIKYLVEYKYDFFSTSVNEDTEKLEGTSFPFWVDYDAYAYLKKRFKNYKWVETELSSNRHLDYLEEVHRVEIPDLGITFEYDNQDPLRRPMWIFLK